MLQNNTFISFLLPAIHEENKVHVRVPNDWEMRNYSTDEFPYEVSTLKIKLLKLV